MAPVSSKTIGQNLTYRILSAVLKLRETTRRAPHQYLGCQLRETDYSPTATCTSRVTHVAQCIVFGAVMTDAVRRASTPLAAPALGLSIMCMATRCGFFWMRGAARDAAFLGYKVRFRPLQSKTLISMH